MRAFIVSIFRPFHANYRSPYFIIRHRIFCFALLILGAAVVSSVIGGAPGKNPKSNAGKVQQQRAKSVAATPSSTPSASGSQFGGRTGSPSGMALELVRLAAVSWGKPMIWR